MWTSWTPSWWRDVGMYLLGVLTVNATDEVGSRELGFICRLCIFIFICSHNMYFINMCSWPMILVHFDSSMWCMIFAKRRWQKPWTSLTQWKIGWLLSSSQLLRVRCLFEWHLTSNSYEGGAFRNLISLVVYCLCDVYVCIPRWARFPMWCIYLLCI